MMETARGTDSIRFDRHDTYDWYLDLGPLCERQCQALSRQDPDLERLRRPPGLRRVLAAADHDPPHSLDVKVPTLNVAGWWDQEDFYGPVKIYEALERHDAEGAELTSSSARGTTAAGARRPGDKLGTDRVRQSATAQVLPRRDPGALVRVLPQGQGEARTARGPDFRARLEPLAALGRLAAEGTVGTPRLYFGPGDAFRSTPPTEADGRGRRFVSDPAHPVPYRHRPIQPTYFPGSRWSTGWSRTSGSSTDRPDVLSWETAPLDTDLTIAGEVMAHLFASTTGSDADWVVKLIDVYPEAQPGELGVAGYQLMVSNEVFRGRYRKDFEHPEPIPAGEVLEYSFSLHTQNYTFRKGHRSWSRCRARGSPSSTAIPRRSCPISSRRMMATSGGRNTASTGRPNIHHTSRSRSLSDLAREDRPGYRTGRVLDIRQFLATAIMLLERRRIGWAGFWVGNGSGGGFANLKISAAVQPVESTKLQTAGCF